MDTLQKQLNVLSSKVDGLHQLIEQVSSRVSEIVSECKLGAENTPHSEFEQAINYRSYKGVSSLDSSLEHKDVLVDGDSLDAALQNSDRKLSPEIQIQRLTAQLTAAYSRIAALEEQLISQRIHY
jgi:predicted lipoprotein